MSSANRKDPNVLELVSADVYAHHSGHAQRALGLTAGQANMLCCIATWYPNPAPYEFIDDLMRRVFYDRGRDTRAIATMVKHIRRELKVWREDGGPGIWIDNFPSHGYGLRLSDEWLAREKELELPPLTRLRATNRAAKPTARSILEMTVMEAALEGHRVMLNIDAGAVHVAAGDGKDAHEATVFLRNCPFVQVHKFSGAGPVEQINAGAPLDWIKDHWRKMLETWGLRGVTNSGGEG